MKKIYFTLVALLATINTFAQGWPANYGGVMLQGFSWNSYDYSQWSVLEKQASNMKGYIDLVWVPQSGRCLETTQVMGYAPYYYFDQNSSFGTEAQLRSMIKALKANGIGTIADVVINHHQTDGWFTFPKETYKGTTYQFQSTDIVADDDKGKTADQAKAAKVSLSSNDDEGEGWDGCRDLDHKSANVQKIIKAYVDFLKNGLGYDGFRYDMVKGFDGSHVADYNDAVGIKYSVGEYWDGNEKIINWINATNKKSAAFDFQFRYNVRDAINGNTDGKVAASSNWIYLNTENNLMHDPNYRQYAVTFVENHDMQYRSEEEPLDPLRKDTLAANAYMLAMPGTPCIFQPHWRAYEQELKSMIDARKLAGITNMSNYTVLKNAKTYYAGETTGNKAKLIVVVGDDTKTYQPANNYVKILDGYHYRYYLAKNAETAWASKASGTYEAAFKATLTAVSQSTVTKLVYTTDGTEPTAKSTQVVTGSTIDIANSCTLKVGLLINGTVSGVRTYNYTIKAFEPYTITVYANTGDVNWGNTMYFYAWNSNGTITKAWPGTAVTQTKNIGGKEWYYMDFKINNKDEVVNVIFNQGNGTNKRQTVDLSAGNSTKYFEVNSTMDNGKFTCKDVTAEMSTTGIANAPIVENKANADNAWYTLTGIKMMQKPAKAGIYIHQGKKIVIK